MYLVWKVERLWHIILEMFGSDPQLLNVDVASFIQRTFSWSMLYFFSYSSLNSDTGNVIAYGLGFDVFW